ncbi:MAG: hypothetical protein V4563_15900 [Pseudomonadota bacterium]
MKLKIERAVLVYQAGIANVFAVDCFNFVASGRTATRLLQSDFRTAEAFARGLAAAGTRVASAGCNMAGDIARCGWSADLDAQPFSDKFSPVWAGVNPELHISFEPVAA